MILRDIVRRYAEVEGIMAEGDEACRQIIAEISKKYVDGELEWDEFVCRMGYLIIRFDEIKENYAHIISLLQKAATEVSE